MGGHHHGHRGEPQKFVAVARDFRGADKDGEDSFAAPPWELKKLFMSYAVDRSIGKARKMAPLNAAQLIVSQATGVSHATRCLGLHLGFVLWRRTDRDQFCLTGLTVRVGAVKMKLFAIHNQCEVIDLRVRGWHRSRALHVFSAHKI